MATESDAEKYVAGYDIVERAAEGDPASAANQVAAFVDYQTRADIESRADILARETAEPGSIAWNEDGTFTVTDPQ